MAVGRYVVISEDTSNKVIVSGPIKADPAQYDPGPGLDLMLEADALAAGYTWPDLPLS